jgi:hypothetical protein
VVVSCENHHTLNDISNNVDEEPKKRAPIARISVCVRMIVMLLLMR